jgi:hypothetical protein
MLDFDNLIGSEGINSASAPKYFQNVTLLTREYTKFIKYQPTSMKRTMPSYTLRFREGS